jgi:cold shock CspA family protein
VDTQDEIYFHRHSVLHDEFDRLTIGLGVRYTAQLGDKGLQATSVQIVDTPRTPVEAPFRG